MCFQDLLQQLELLLIYTYSTNIVVGSYTLASRIDKVAVELPNMTEELVGVQLCTLFLLQICLTDGTTFS